MKQQSFFSHTYVQKGPEWVELKKKKINFFFLKKKNKKKLRKKMQNEIERKKMQTNALTTLHGFCSSALSPWWYVLHMMSFNYPTQPTREERLRYQNWFETTLELIPCDVCKNPRQCLDMIGYNPQIDLATRSAFVVCVWDLHNKINERLQKPFFPLHELIYQMEQFRASECNEDSCTLASTMLEPHCKIVMELKSKRLK